ncbi:MAG: T9SS type A sorting domain-containing protein [Candidatus Hermodarchaeota archaeon]
MSGTQGQPDVKLWNERIYNTWTDNPSSSTTSGSGDDIWANVLDWGTPPVGISDKKGLQIPSAFILSQNYPNQFNPSTTIEFDLPKACKVTLKIFSILGEEVAKLVSDRLSAGNNSYDWSQPPAGMASGVYLYRLSVGSLTTKSGHYVAGEAGDFIATKKMILMK